MTSAHTVVFGEEVVAVTLTTAPGKQPASVARAAVEVPGPVGVTWPCVRGEETAARVHTLPVTRELCGEAVVPRAARVVGELLTARPGVTVEITLLVVCRAIRWSFLYITTCGEWTQLKRRYIRLNFNSLRNNTNS